jgi:hypothetical protein
MIAILLISCGGPSRSALESTALNKPVVTVERDGYEYLYSTNSYGGVFSLSGDAVRQIIREEMTVVRPLPNEISLPPTSLNSWWSGLSNEEKRDCWFMWEIANSNYRNMSGEYK